MKRVSTASTYLTGKILRRALNLAQVKASVSVRSSQLREGLNCNVDIETPKLSQGAVNVPHYWARWYHDGRSSVTPSTAPVLIWFRNPKQDPRLKGGKYPVHKSQVRRLSKGDLRKWSRINSQKVNRYLKATGKRRKDLGPDDYKRMQLPMIVTTYSSPTRQHKINRFFDNNFGMQGMDKILDKVAQEEMYSYVKARLDKAGLTNAVVKVTI